MNHNQRGCSEGWWGIVGKCADVAWVLKHLSFMQWDVRRRRRIRVKAADVWCTVGLCERLQLIVRSDEVVLSRCRPWPFHVRCWMCHVCAQESCDIHKRPASSLSQFEISNTLMETTSTFFFSHLLHEGDSLDVLFSNALKSVTQMLFITSDVPQENWPVSFRKPRSPCEVNHHVKWCSFSEFLSCFSVQMSEDS